MVLNCTCTKYVSRKSRYFLLIEASQDELQQQPYISRLPALFTEQGADGEVAVGHTQMGCLVL